MSAVLPSALPRRHGRRTAMRIFLVTALVASGTTLAVRAAKAFVAGAGPSTVHFDLTDNNDGWFDTGTQVFGTKSLAVAELPRAGLGTLGVTPADVTSADVGSATKGLVAGAPNNPAIQIPGVPSALDSLATVSTALDTLKPHLDKIGLAALA